MNIENWLAGPVAITGADGHVGRALQGRLATLSNPIRPLRRPDDWTSAITTADAVIHLAGTLRPRRPNSYQAANIETTERVLDAVSGSSAQRMVFLSYVGADPNSNNEYLRTKGQAEELIAASGIPFVILRSTFIYGHPNDIGPSFASYQTESGGTVSVVGDGSQKAAPIHVDDITGMLAAAALDPSTPTGTFEVSGSEIFTVDEFIRRINHGEVTIRHLASPVAKLLVWFTPQLTSALVCATSALVDVLLSNSVASGDPAETAARFGVDLHPSAETVRITEELTS